MRRAAVLLLAFAAAPAGAMDLCATPAACARQELAQAQTQLDAVYQQVHAQLGAPGSAEDARHAKARAGALTELAAGQQAWISYREHECAAVRETWSNATVRTLMALNCLTTLTSERTEQLKQHLDTH